jgi:hypothetical protein
MFYLFILLADEEGKRYKWVIKNKKCSANEKNTSRDVNMRDVNRISARDLMGMILLILKAKSAGLN